VAAEAQLLLSRARTRAGSPGSVNALLLGPG